MKIETPPTFPHRQGKQSAVGVEQSIADAFTVTLKIICWVIDQIPGIGSWFLERYKRTIPDTDRKLSTFTCPSYFTPNQKKESRAGIAERVSALYQRRASVSSVHIGSPDRENRRPLSPDYISASIRVLPSIPLTKLSIHGPIASQEDRENLQTIIKTTTTLATLHLELEKESAIDFAKEVHNMLEDNRTITERITRRSNNRWENLNKHRRRRRTLTYINL
ncbi:MAG: hypothetical protein AAGE99_05940 [Chlamydiota bacterium]